MVTRTERLTQVPDDRVDKIMAMFKAEGAKKIHKIQEPEGTWTVEAIFPVDPSLQSSG